MESQVPAPQAIVNRPEVLEELAGVWEAFWFLHTMRPVGMVVGPIPLSEMVTYWRTISPTSFLADKVMLLRAMDGHYLNWVAGKK